MATKTQYSGTPLTPRPLTRDLVSAIDRWAAQLTRGCIEGQYRAEMMEWDGFGWACRVVGLTGGEREWSGRIYFRGGRWFRLRDISATAEEKVYLD